MEKTLLQKISLTKLNVKMKPEMRRTILITKCFSCTDYDLQLPSHIASSDRVLVTPEEVLIFPADSYNDKEWVELQ